MEKPAGLRGGPYNKSGIAMDSLESPDVDINCGVRSSCRFHRRSDCGKFPRVYLDFNVSMSYRIERLDDLSRGRPNHGFMQCRAKFGTAWGRVSRAGLAVASVFLRISPRGPCDLS